MNDAQQKHFCIWLCFFTGECKETEFQCIAGKCKHDYNHDDEDYCILGCIPHSKLNNGIVDCIDGSDEPLTGKHNVANF